MPATLHAFLRLARKLHPHAPRIARGLHAVCRPLWDGLRRAPSPHAAASTLSRICPDPHGSARCPRRQLPHADYDLAVIVAAYNMEAYIAECLDSILGQATRYKVTVKVVDDGSTDATPSILARYAARHKEVDVITLDSNQGPAAARNAALDRLNATYVAIVDADDLLAPGGIEAALGKALATDADAVETSLTRFHDDGRIDYTLTPADSDDTRHADIVGNSTVFLYHWRMLADVRFPPGYQLEDEMLKGLVLPRARKIVSVSAPYYRYRVRRGSLCLSFNSPRQLHALYVGRSLYTDALAMGLWSDNATAPAVTTAYLRLVRFSFLHTFRFPPAVRKSVFSLWCDFHPAVARHCRPQSPADTELLDALTRRSYRDYEWNCIINQRW